MQKWALSFLIYIWRSPAGGQRSGELHDLSEAPLAYKDIDMVIEVERDLVRPLVHLRPLAVLC